MPDILNSLEYIATIETEVFSELFQSAEMEKYGIMIISFT